MSTSVASDFEAPRPSRGGRGEKAAFFAAKLLVTGACFWYISRHIDLNQVLSTIPLLDFRWAALAILVAMLEIPLAGLRWYNIVDSLGARDKQMTRIALVAATAVGVFFAQVLPLRRCAGKSVAVFGMLRPRAGGWLAAWSAGLALVSVRVRSAFGPADRMKGEEGVSGFQPLRQQEGQLLSLRACNSSPHECFELGVGSSARATRLPMATVFRKTGPSANSKEKPREPW